MCSINFNCKDVGAMPVVFASCEKVGVRGYINSVAQWYFSTSLDWVEISSSKLENDVFVHTAECKSHDRLTWLIKRVVLSVGILVFAAAKWNSDGVKGKVNVLISSKERDGKAMTKSAEMEFTGGSRTVKYTYEQQKDELRYFFETTTPSGYARLVKRCMINGFVAEGEFDDKHRITSGTVYKNGEVHKQGIFTYAGDSTRPTCVPYAEKD
ncbi:MAG: hypothetical protein P0S94_00030 [Simkaniaceae bacterium]|nr:hypothetical protein [Simkaniaceae bacterium]